MTISKEVHNKFILPTHVLGVENLLVDSLCIYFCGRSKKKMRVPADGSRYLLVSFLHVNNNVILSHYAMNW